MSSTNHAEHSAGYLKLEQSRNLVADSVIEDVDIFLSFSSYDPRCLEITKTRIGKVGRSFVFKFTPFGEDNGRSHHANVIAQYLSGHGDTVEPSQLGKSVDVPLVIEQLQTCLSGAVRQIGRAVSVGIDISCVPKVYMLFLTAWFLRNGLASRLSFFYAEGQYPALSNESSAVLEFRSTDGRWLSYQVPYLEGHFHPGRPRHAVISMGSEIASLEKFITRYDPDSVTLLSPVPGLTETLDKIAQRQANVVRRNLGATTVLESPARDAVSSLVQLLDVAKARLRNDDVMLFSFGPKPQALVMGLAGLLVRELPVICRIPHRYVDQPIFANGWAWKYSVQDLSAP